MSLKLLLLSVLQSLMLAGGQLCLKLAMVRTPHFRFTWEVIRQYLLNYWLALCGLLMGGATVLWMHILKHYPFSQAYPMSSMAYDFGILAGVFIFHETSTLTKWIGAALIIAGAVLLARE